ncbi:hypothetical protein [Sutcliffiella halmapala]|uniref:hypothetical protein n=1 Tax=Sutcliffiella halmapala TaxID=79882 RepID=UPI000995D401|nr:hypothetical protein [Sutcliffiella halmapala]
MDLYCSKHKKLLAERFNSINKEIEPYCVDCHIESKFQVQIELNKIECKDDVIKSKGVKFWSFLIVTFIVIVILPIHIFFKVLLTLVLLAKVIKNVLNPYLSRLTQPQSHLLDEIRAQALNQSSIQANEVENKKRQWKKAFLQEKNKTKWTEEDWQEYLKRFYKK